jgi:hypothetical protein
MILTQNTETPCNNSSSYIQEDDKTQGNRDNEDTVILIYDIECSEHITHNKDILTNFRNEKVEIRCANNTKCSFNGIGTFEGTINGKIYLT